MKKIMRGVLLFGMLGGMLLSCGNNNTKNDSNSKAKEDIKTEKVFKVGVSQIVDHPALNDAKKGFMDAVEKGGIKVDYDDKIANNDMGAQTMIMKQFAADKKDLVYAITTPTAQAAKNQITDVPIVIASVTDPQGAGLVGIENVTGTSGAAPINENLELMKELFPNAKKIGIIYNSSEQNSVSEVNNLKILANEKGFEVIDKAVTNGSELVSAINIVAKQVDIFYAIQDNTVASYFQTLLETLNKEKVPVFGTNNIYSDTGGFVSQGTTDYGIGYRAGEIAVDILKNGKKPADIPIETVKDLKIEINKENMELLGIKLSDKMKEKVKFVETKK